jgi:hypothetical protein
MGRPAYSSVEITLTFRLRGSRETTVEEDNGPWSRHPFFLGDHRVISGTEPIGLNLHNVHTTDSGATRGVLGGGCWHRSNAIAPVESAERTSGRKIIPTIDFQCPALFISPGQCVVQMLFVRRSLCPAKERHASSVENATTCSIRCGRGTLGLVLFAGPHLKACMTLRSGRFRHDGDRRRRRARSPLEN